MSTTDVPVESAAARSLGHAAADATVEALRNAIFGPQRAVWTHVRDIVAGLPDLSRPYLIDARQSKVAPVLLRTVIAAVNRPGREIAVDTRLRGALVDWAAVAAPRLVLPLVGHLDLAIGAIASLGNGSDYQRQRLAALDTGASVGVLMIAELDGADGADQQTTATWDREGDGFWLTSPTSGSIEMVPAVADAASHETAVVTARLLVDGRDEGVFPFVFDLRTAAGLVDGTHVVHLPDEFGAPTDHAMVRFDRVWLPRAALLGGDWARIDADGRFKCAVPQPERFHRAITVLGDLRLDLANASVAMARAGLAGLVNHSRQRRSGSGIARGDRDAVRRDLVTGVAAVYAIGALGRHLRDAPERSGDSQRALWSMLAKPLLSETAHRVLEICRQWAGAQGTLGINHLVDWIATTSAITATAGENHVLRVRAGELIAQLGVFPQLPGAPGTPPWYIEMLAQRERIIAAGIRIQTYGNAGVALGPDAAAIELATATAERAAASALFADALRVPDPTARLLVASAAAAYALDRIHARGMWYAEHSLLSTDHATRITTTLRLHHATLAEKLPTLVAAFDIPALPGPLFSGGYTRALLDYPNRNDTSRRD
ncbi:acyl-CoA dehydrogenase family protein [Nocardia sp. NPDC046763]|uniref:acyl-CoA dehydrogenase family protein n=1 Tax=Nocardia sp. NPDC046763 TaxID=3155256 RepID=UPI0033DFEBBB